MKRHGALLGLLLLVLGTVAALWLLRRHPPDVKLRGQVASLSHPSGVLTVRAPAFLGPPRMLTAPRVVGVAFGDFGGAQSWLVTVSPHGDAPFAGLADVPSGVADGYMGCMMLALPGQKSSWWEVVARDQAGAAQPPLAWLAAVNRIPIVSRVCVAGTNDNAPLDVRVYGSVLRETWELFQEDVRAFVSSVSVDAVRARALFGLPEAETAPAGP